MTLGNGEVTLLELTNAYASLARNGQWRPARWISAVRRVDGAQIGTVGKDNLQQLFEQRVAHLLTDILSDPVARRPAFGNAFHFPFPCAVKTGTTKDYRDNWTVGYTTKYTVGVWVGNFDGSAMRGVSGITGAGHIFSDIMMLLHLPPTGSPSDEWSPPAGLKRVSVCARSGKLPGRHCVKTVPCWFLKENLPSEKCDMHQLFRVTTEEGELTRVYEILPPEYSEWVMDLRLPAPPPDAVRVEEAERARFAGRRPASLAIASPNDGDIFKLDPVLRREFQTIKIVGIVGGDVEGAMVVVDGDERIPLAGGQAWWQLKKGIHKLLLSGETARGPISSRSVVVIVE